MKKKYTTNELSDQLKAELKSMPLVVAPKELWMDVSAELSSSAHSFKVKSFSHRRALAAAAALLMFFGITFQFIWPSSEWQPELYPVTDELTKEKLRSRVIFMEVAAGDLSSLAKDMAFSLGGVEDVAMEGSE